MLITDWLHSSQLLPHRLHIERHGNPHGPQVVLIHGIATSSAIWQPLIRELQADYHLITLDLLGHGQSPKPTQLEYTTDEHVRAIRWTLFTHGLWRPSIFVGFSIGALIASRLAAHYPHVARRLVLAAPPIYKQPTDLSTSAADTVIDRAYLSIYRALRRVPKRVAVRSADMVKRRIPAVLGVNRLDEHTWYPIVSTLRSTIEQQAVSRDVDRWGSRIPAAVFYGSLDHLVIAKNVRAVFARRSGVHLERLVAPHELTKTYLRHIAAAIREAV